MEGSRTTDERRRRATDACAADELVDRPLERPIHASGAPGAPGVAGVGRRVCLIAPLDPARGLSLSLAQHLAEEMPELDLCLRPRADVAAIWLCGYEPGHADAVRALRRAHPHGVLLVTGRAPLETWADEARAAGADHVSPWPAPVQELARVLASG